MANNLPTLPDVETFKTIFQNILPAPMAGNRGPALDRSILTALRIMDEQDAIQSVEWFGLPPELPKNLIERIMYYRANGMFFYMEETDQFYFLPYVGEQIDVYGRYRFTSALPFNGTVEANNKKEKDRPWISGRFWEPQYGIVYPSDWKYDMITKKCVILTDYSRQMPQKVQPRQAIMEPLLQVMSEIIPFMRTSLLNGTGIEGVRIDNQDEAPQISLASRMLTNAAIYGDRWIPLIGNLTTEVLSHSQQTKCEEYLLALQALDNLRLSLHGLDNGGLFQKKAHMLQDEQNMNASTASLIMADRIAQRQEFCDIVNSIWGLGIWCEPSEIVNNVDRNMNGQLDNNDEAKSNPEKAQEGGEENV